MFFQGEVSRATVSTVPSAPHPLFLAASGWYWLTLAGNVNQFYCDMVNDGGGWTAIIDPSVKVRPAVANAASAPWSQALYYEQDHANPSGGVTRVYGDDAFGVANQNSVDRGGNGYAKV
jgi:hypothetical protein